MFMIYRVIMLMLCHCQFYKILKTKSFLKDKEKSGDTKNNGDLKKKGEENSGKATKNDDGELVKNNDQDIYFKGDVETTFNMFAKMLKKEEWLKNYQSVLLYTVSSVLVVK